MQPVEHPLGRVDRARIENQIIRGRLIRMFLAISVSENRAETFAERIELLEIRLEILGLIKFLVLETI